MNRIGNQRVDNQILILPVAAGKEIYAGTMVVLGADGYAKPAAKEADLVTAGVAFEYADNRNGDAGAISVEVRRGAFVFSGTAAEGGVIAETDLLKDCYIENETTVTLAAAGSSRAGKILAAAADGITIEI